MQNSNTDNKITHPARPYILFGLYLILLLVLFLCFFHSPGSGGTGSSSGYGQGTGAGEKGDGQGSGGSSSGVGSADVAVPSEINSGGGGSGQAKVEGGPEAVLIGVPESKAPPPPKNPVVMEWASGRGGAPEASAPATAGSEGKRSFYGIEVGERENALFLVDVSGSMGSTTPEGRSRLEVLKLELLNVIGRTQAAQAAGSFGARVSTGISLIVAFSDGVTEYKRGNTQAAESVRIREFIGNLNAAGGTSMLGAWQHILPNLGRGGIDVVYFLSDGDPTDCEGPELEEFLKQNLPSGVRVNCFSIGKESQLLKNIATQHRGKYVVRY